MKTLIRNVGAHAATLLEVPTVAAVHGPSTAGKSTIADGLCLLLTGRDAAGRAWTADRLRDPDEAARIAWTFDGMRIARDFSARPGATTIDGKKCTSQMQVDSALGMADRRELVRCIVAPFYWRSLLDSPKSRGFRDAILHALPAVDVRPIVAEAMADAGGLHADDPLVLGKPSQPDTALHRQRSQNQRAAVLLGRHDAAVDRRQAVEDRQPVPVDAPSVVDAQQVLEMEAQYRAWEAHAAAVATNQARRSDHELHLQAWTRRETMHDERERQRLADWQTRRAAVGDRPALPDWTPADIDADRSELQRIRHGLQKVAEEADEVRRAAHRTEQILNNELHATGRAHEQACADLESMQNRGECPTCHRGADEQDIARLAAVAQEKKDAYLALMRTGSAEGPCGSWRQQDR
jgi:DNA repair exonuclease SbcCD ATPase subunit